MGLRKYFVFKQEVLGFKWSLFLYLTPAFGDEGMHLDHIFKLHSARNLSFSVSSTTKILTELHLEMGFTKSTNNHKT